MKLKPNHLLFILLGTLFILNLLQGHFTELLFDEAYYWYYARDLSWGYFDHPPMVAVLIKLSGLFFEGELGVRFMSTLLSVGTLYILWQLVDHPGKKAFIPHFFALVFSMTLLNAYGFFTLPDTPLLFFTALFLWGYKKFLENESSLLAVGLGLVMAALMYSKYHAVLVILFVLISNYRLVFSPRAWLAVGVALLSYTPHFIWLFENDFVSIRYHLYERPNHAYEFNEFTLGYFLNLIALFGFTFPWIYMSLFKTRARSTFDRALLYLVYGVVLFFFVSSFQRRVQTQWVIVICIPMVLIAYRYMLEHKNYRKWLFRTALINGVILVFLRIGLIYQPLFPIVFETHGNKKWVGELTSQVGDTPVVFENSYRKAPMYTFYSGHTSYSLNNIFYRENQYNIDGSEARVQHRKVLLVSMYFKEGDLTYYAATGEKYYGKFIEDFESFRELEGELILSENVDARDSVEFRLRNPYDETIPLDKLRFGIAYLDDYKKVQEIKPVNVRPLLDEAMALEPLDTTYIRLKLPEPGIDDPGYYKLTISENGLPWGINSSNVKLE